eukprot:2583352-Prymnesium_polylepis.1
MALSDEGGRVGVIAAAMGLGGLPAATAAAAVGGSALLLMSRGRWGAALARGGSLAKAPREPPALPAVSPSPLGQGVADEQAWRLAQAQLRANVARRQRAQEPGDERKDHANMRNVSQGHRQGPESAKLDVKFRKAVKPLHRTGSA